jgi:hypothetical protein
MTGTLGGGNRIRNEGGGRAGGDAVKTQFTPICEEHDQNGKDRKQLAAQPQKTRANQPLTTPMTPTRRQSPVCHRRQYSPAERFLERHVARFHLRQKVAVRGRAHTAAAAAAAATAAVPLLAFHKITEVLTDPAPEVLVPTTVVIACRPGPSDMASGVASLFVCCRCR